MQKIHVVYLLPSWVTPLETHLKKVIHNFSNRNIANLLRALVSKAQKMYEKVHEEKIHPFFVSSIKYSILIKNTLFLIIQLTAKTEKTSEETKNNFTYTSKNCITMPKLMKKTMALLFELLILLKTSQPLTPIGRCTHPIFLLTNHLLDSIQHNHLTYNYAHHILINAASAFNINYFNTRGHYEKR